MQPQLSKQCVLHCYTPIWDTAAAQQKVPLANPSHAEAKPDLVKAQAWRPPVGHEVFGLAACAF